MSSQDLYLVRVDLGLSGLVDLARRRGLPRYDFDEGQAVHCALGEIFRDKAPKPFALPGPRERKRTPGVLQVHAYSSESKEALIASSQNFADLDLYEHFDPDSVKDRRLPPTFPEKMGFSVRLAPVVRLSSDVDVTVELAGESKQLSRRRGAEVDAFEAACLRAHKQGEAPLPSESRGQVYLDWFKALASRTGGFEVERARLDGQQWLRMWRRDHDPKGRKSHKLLRPEIYVSGLLSVTDQREFREVLRRGIGRHKAFGFGMLKLRPAREA